MTSPKSSTISSAISSAFASSTSYLSPSFAASLNFSSILDSSLNSLSVSFSKPTILGLLTTGFLGYLILVRSLRYNRLNRTLCEYYESRQKRGAKPGDPMTEQEAHAIHLRFQQLEFPYLCTVSLQFALFKTYGVPTGSSILVKTGRLACPMTTPKRYADTVALIAEWVQFGPDHPRYYLAISRLNYLHSRYASNISNRDLLYVLGVFILEPIKWINRYEWRSAHELEKEAFYVFWKGVGEKMGIEGIPEPDEKQGLSGWEMVNRWCEDHEEKYMVFSPDNKVVGDETANLLLYYYPEWLKYERSKDGKNQGILRQLLTTFMPPRLTAAMGITYIPKPWVYKLASSILTARRLFIKHLMLPRLYPNEEIETSHPDRSPYEVQYLTWDAAGAEPWYVKPSLQNTYLSPWNWFAYLFLRKFAGRKDIPLVGERDSEGKLKYGEGYYLDSVGPDRYVGKGREEVRERAERMRIEFEKQVPESERIVVGCPFGGFVASARSKGVEEHDNDVE